MEQEADDSGRIAVCLSAWSSRQSHGRLMAGRRGSQKVKMDFHADNGMYIVIRKELAYNT